MMQQEDALVQAAKSGNVAEVKRILLEKSRYCSNVSELISELTLLHYACEEVHLDVVTLLVFEFKADLSAKNSKGRTSLHYACKKGHSSVVEELASRVSRADLSEQDKDGRTPLHYACKKGHSGVVKILISKFELKKDLRVKDDKYGRTPIHYACVKGHSNVVKAFLSEIKKGDLSVQDIYGDTPLHYAYEEGFIDVVQTLVSESKLKVNLSIQNICGWTPIHYACENGHSDVVKASVSEIKKGDLSIQDQNGHTPLHYACKEGHLAVIVALMSYSKLKVDLSIQDENGRTPLHYACKKENSDVVKALVSRAVKADLSVQDTQGHTPLHYACKEGCVDVVRTLASEYNGDLSMKGKNGRTPLQCACEEGHLEIIRALVSEFQVDPSIQGKDGFTPLHHACFNGHLDVVRALVAEFKVDLSTQDAAGCTALMLAAGSGHDDVVLALLRDHQCPVTDRDKDGWGVLHHACAKGSTSVVKTLICDYQINANIPDSTPLQVALDYNNYEVALCLVYEFGCNPNVVDKKGKTLLHYACKRGDINQIRSLIRDCNADINACDKYNKTPLDTAVHNLKMDAVFLLISEFGCNPNVVDKLGQTPFHYICGMGDIDLVCALVREHNADVSIGDFAPLRIALKNENFGLAFCLIHEFNCDPNVANYNGKTLLHYACEKDDLNKVNTLLVYHHADINVRDEQMNMPIHIAAEAGNKEILLALIQDHGCDPNALGSFGRTPLHIAAEEGHHNIITALLKFTSPVVKDKDGDTPLHLASKQGQVRSMQCLLDANAPILIRNNYGETAIDIAEEDNIISLLNEYSKNNHQQIQADYISMSKQANKRYSGPHYITRMLVVGYHGVGKSSFIESLKREGFLKSFSKVSESSVPPHTAGIIPSVHMSKMYGRVMFYDFAGDAEYYSSHAAIFESLASSRKGDNIFIVVVDLREDVEKALYYWFSFIQYQKFSEASFIVVGSHLDQSLEPSECLKKFCTSMQSNVSKIKHFAMDCRDPRSNPIAQLKTQIIEWVRKSQKYTISSEARLLLGLLEKDFSSVTACPVKTLVSHIKDSGAWLPVEPKPLHQILLELHEVGVLLLLGDCTKDNDHVILNVSKLTNEVHERLFAKSAFSNIKNFNIGILPEETLKELLPPYITVECLTHLQYCQEISHSNVSAFPCLEANDSPSKSFLFFPALCKAEKSQVSWDESTGTSFSIGWLALCTRPHDYFPPRFLHVLLLRLVYDFTLSPARQQNEHASPQHSRRCTMWKKGVHWKMEEGVDCMVELVNGSKGVVILSKSSTDGEEDCVRVFTKIISCVMEAKAEFCNSNKPEFFLLDSSAEADYLNTDHQFAMSDVERALENPEGKRVIISVSGRGEMKLSKFQYMRNLTHWNSIFQIDSDSVLRILSDLVGELYDLGQSLEAPRSVIKGIEDDFPNDVNRRRRELVRWWINSFQVTPCWWHLARALKTIDENVLAEKIRNNHDLDYQLQEKLLSEETQDLKPDEQFLHSLSGVVESRWPSLALSLALSEREIEKLKGLKTGLSQQELALKMLNIWASREDATYSNLCSTLKAIFLFLYST